MLAAQLTFRKIRRTLLVIILLLVTLVVVHRVLLPILAWIHPSLKTPFYDLAIYGVYPERNYVSFDIPSPQPNLVQWNERCDSGQVLVTLNGPSIRHPGPSIYDAHGDLLWTTEKYGTVLNMRMQRYKEQNFLTFWAGEKAGTMGQGRYYMLNSSYDVFKEFDAVGETFHGDLHEFKITNEGTALITVYTTAQADLTSMGLWRRRDGWIIDSLFQEIDLEDNKLLFEWRASEHFPPAQTFMTNPFGGYRQSGPFDSFHINSVDKDPYTGNYLISSRHTHTISLVNSKTGDIIWQLGGANNDFKDLSDGRATSFTWQHDARWIKLPSHTDDQEGIHTISFLDNGKAGALHVDAHHSVARIVRLDTKEMTAELVQDLASHQYILAGSQGSVDILPNSGNIFVGWGASAAWSEFDPVGNLLCEVHLSAGKSFSWERVKSYRVFKTHDWIGNPSWPVNAVIQRGKAFISWNGATEVRYWELQARKESNEGWRTIDIVKKTAFENVIALPSQSEGWAHFRVVALDDGRKVLGASESVMDMSTGTSARRLGIALLLLPVAFIAVWRMRAVFPAILYHRDAGGHGWHD